MTSWSNKEVLKTLGLTGLVNAGLYDVNGTQFMWAARFGSLLEDFKRSHPIEAAKAKVHCAVAQTLISPLAFLIHLCESRQVQLGLGTQLSDIAKDAGDKDIEAKW